MNEETNYKSHKKVIPDIGIIDPQGRTKKIASPKLIVPTLRSETHGNEPKVCIPVLTPDRANKRQNGRRFKEDGEVAFTLTGQDKHGVAIEVDSPINNNDIGESSNIEERPDSITVNYNDTVIHAVWYEKYQCYIAIRKLTPKECFRLQGWADDYFEKAEFVNSDSQLYKQAGNGITVSVVEAIAQKLSPNPITFVDLFAGVGGLRRGMELAGHKCIGFCEFDKYARASYISMHCIDEAQRSYLSSLSLNQRQKEILKDEYLNGEWSATDIREVTGDSIPKVDCWGFGAPCQDFSVAGKRRGLDGDRSSLIREVFRILKEIKEEDRPEWLIYENVKGMFSSNRGFDYFSILCAMDELGYDVEWQLLNSKDFGVPQNRERVYTIGHLRSRGESKVFPIGISNKEDSVRQIEETKINIIGHRENYRRNTQIFALDGLTEALDTGQGGAWSSYRNPCKRQPQRWDQRERNNDNEYTDGEGLQRSWQPRYDRGFGIDFNRGGQPRPLANTIKARYTEGVTNFKQDGTAVALPIDVKGLMNEDVLPTDNQRFGTEKEK